MLAVDGAPGTHTQQWHTLLLLLVLQVRNKMQETFGSPFCFVSGIFSHGQAAEVGGRTLHCILGGYRIYHLIPPSSEPEAGYYFLLQ